jgi:outer membrane protein OmpA-like peptidoglycan-associated protein
MRITSILLPLCFLTIGLCAQQKIELISLGKKVNTRYHEGAPIISADGNTLYFFVTNHPDNTYGKEGSQDIWYSERQSDGLWGESQHISKPLNQHHSNEVFKVFPDGQSLFIRGGKSKNSKGFSFSYKSGSLWGSSQEIEVENFKKMNIGRFYGATMSSDKKTMLIYMSEKEHSAFSDLYVSFVQADGKWSMPEKIGSPINTSRDEFAPFLSHDDKTMYYSSSRKDMGLGGPDIYKTTRLDDTWLSWSTPENMGKPINTRAFDAYMSVDEEGNLFVTSAGDMRDGGNLDIYTLKPKEPELRLIATVSNRESEETIESEVSLKAHRNGKDTIINTAYDGAFEMIFLKEVVYEASINSRGYQPYTSTVTIPTFESDTTMYLEFTLTPKIVKPIVSGTVYDEKTKEVIEAEVLYSSSEDFNEKPLITDNGYFEIEVEIKQMYYFNVSKEGYLNANDSLDISEMEDPIFAGKDIYLTPIEVGTTVRLDHIYFDFDKATLKPASYEELDKVVEFLNDNETISIEIGGHTDSKGADDYNQRLSHSRAESVRTYVTEQGIEAARITAQGYGESQPEETNDTEEGRATNRRVVFTVLEK